MARPSIGASGPSARLGERRALMVGVMSAADSCGVARRRRRYRSRHGRHAGGGGKRHRGPEQRQPTTSASAQRGRRGSEFFGGPRSPGSSRLAGGDGPRTGGIVRQSFRSAQSVFGAIESVDDSLLRDCSAESAPFPRRRRASRYVGCHGRSRSDHPRGIGAGAVHLVPGTGSRPIAAHAAGRPWEGNPEATLANYRDVLAALARGVAPRRLPLLSAFIEEDLTDLRRAKPTGRSSRRSSVPDILYKYASAELRRTVQSGPAAPHHESQPTCLARRRDSRGGHRRVPPDR